MFQKMRYNNLQDYATSKIIFFMGDSCGKSHASRCVNIRMWYRRQYHILDEWCLPLSNWKSIFSRFLNVLLKSGHYIPVSILYYHEVENWSALDYLSWQGEQSCHIWNPNRGHCRNNRICGWQGDSGILILLLMAQSHHGSFSVRLCRQERHLFQLWNLLCTFPRYHVFHSGQ